MVAIYIKSIPSTHHSLTLTMSLNFSHTLQTVHAYIFRGKLQEEILAMRLAELYHAKYFEYLCAYHHFVFKDKSRISIQYERTDHFIDSMLFIFFTYFISISSSINFNGFLRLPPFYHEGVGFNSVLVSISVITQTNNLRHSYCVAWLDIDTHLMCDCLGKRGR